MKFGIGSFVKGAAILSLVVAASACSNTPSKPQAEAPPQAAVVDMRNHELYEVHAEGRIYYFYDRASYLEFLKMGETPYRKTFIGAGPHGETVVYGLTSADKKKLEGIPSIDLVSGKLAPADDFYAETRMHGRIYVFNSLADMEPVRQFGHPNFFYMEVGAGPQGETVVYVLNKTNKKHKPTALMQRFQKMYNN